MVPLQVQKYSVLTGGSIHIQLSLSYGVQVHEVTRWNKIRYWSVQASLAAAKP